MGSMPATEGADFKLARASKTQRMLSKTGLGGSRPFFLEGKLRPGERRGSSFASLPTEGTPHPVETSGARGQSPARRSRSGMKDDQETTSAGHDPHPAALTPPTPLLPCPAAHPA